MLSSISEIQQRRILVDCRKVQDGGIGTYTRNLVRALSSFPDFSLTLLGDPARIKESFPDIQFDVLEEYAAGYSLGELFQLGRRVETRAFDLFHTPHYPLPYGIRTKSLITVHDLIHLYHPERFYYPFVAQRLFRSALSRADGVLAVSNSTADQVASHFSSVSGIPEKLSVVPNALSDGIRAVDGAKDYIASRFGIQQPFVLSVFSQLKRHKGMRDLLKAFASLKEEKSCDRLELVLIGLAIEELPERAELFELAGSIKGVRIVGAVKSEELSAFYTAARGVVIPSRAEGFGLPMLEAHCCGTPVVIRPVPALRELSLPEDVICQDFSVKSLKHAIEAVASQSQRIPKSSVSFLRYQYSLRSLGMALRGAYARTLGVDLPLPSALGEQYLRVAGLQ